MATYCFKCPLCGLRLESSGSGKVWCPRGLQGWPDGPLCNVLMKRNFRAEGFQVGAGVRMAANQADAADILPSYDDFKKPEDPDGVKGMRNWHEEHRPSEGNKNPKWPGGREMKKFL